MTIKIEELYDKVLALSSDVEDTSWSSGGHSGSCWIGTPICSSRPRRRATCDAGKRIISSR